MNFELNKEKTTLGLCFDEIDFKGVTLLSPKDDVYLLSAKIKIEGIEFTTKSVDLFALLSLFEFEYDPNEKTHKHKLRKESSLLFNYLDQDGKVALVNCHCGEPTCLNILGECFTIIKKDFICLYIPKKDLKIINKKARKFLSSTTYNGENYYVLTSSLVCIFNAILNLKKEIKELCNENTLMLNNIDLNLKNVFNNSLLMRMRGIYE